MKIVEGFAKKEKDVDQQSHDMRVVNAIRSGNKDAFRHLYSKYGRFIGHYCHMSIGDRATCKDMVQDIMTKIYVNIDKYKEECTFNAWVWRIAKNHLVDHWRRQKNDLLNPSNSLKISSGEEEDGSVPDSMIDSGWMNPEEIYIRKRADECVRGMLGMMSERERRVVEMFYFENKTYEQIASELSIGMVMTKTSLFRAKDKIKRRLGKMVNLSDLINC